MDNQPSSLKFAAIGHQDSWSKIVKFLNMLRQEEGNSALSKKKIKEMYSFIPPTKLFDVQVNSPLAGTAEGFYIETFISPDELGPSHLWKNIEKVKAACEKAAALGADVVSLGGFTSILLEAGGENLAYINKTAFTTGNTLTAAFIADAIEKAVESWHKPLEASTLLVIGSTGDIGSACVDYFAGRVDKLLLTARQPIRLKQQESRLQKKGISCNSSVVVSSLLHQADIVICVASSPLPYSYIDMLPDHAIICDAAYPKNFHAASEVKKHKLFAGGMGHVKHGYQFSPNTYHPVFCDFPISNVSHGCLLEAVVLAMENKAIAYSAGRGNIRKINMEEMLQMATRHEIMTAPFFTHPVKQKKQRSEK